MITVIELIPRVKGIQQQCLVRCVCGKEYTIRYVDAIRAKSCGCLRSQGSRGVNKKHGMRGHELYGVWRQMMQRCYEPSHEAYNDYGGRGIKVEKSWHYVEIFIADIAKLIGPRPKGYTLDRTRNNESYKPSNVRWASRITQCRNRRNNLLIEIDGETKCPSAWAEETGISRSTIVDRYVTQGLRGRSVIKPVKTK